MRPTSPFKRSTPGPQNGPPAKKTGSNGQMPPQPRKTVPGPRKGANGARAAVLSGEASAILRDQLLAEMEGLGLKDDLDAWTLRAWPKANTLTPADGDKVRQAFQARLGRLQTTPDEDLSPAEPDPPAANDETRSRIDKSVLALPEAQAAAGQAAPAVRGQTALPRLRPRALRPPPSAVCAIPRARPKGQRRIHGPAVPGTPSRTAPRRQGNRLVVQNGNRTLECCARTMARHPSPDTTLVAAIELCRGITGGFTPNLSRLNFDQSDLKTPSKG